MVEVRMFLKTEEGAALYSCLWGGGHLLCIQAPLTALKSTVGKEAAPLCFLPALSSLPLDMISVYQVHIVPVNSSVMKHLHRIHWIN